MLEKDSKGRTLGWASLYISKLDSPATRAVVVIMAGIILKGKGLREKQKEREKKRRKGEKKKKRKEEKRGKREPASNQFTLQTINRINLVTKSAQVRSSMSKIDMKILIIILLKFNHIHLGFENKNKSVLKSVKRSLFPLFSTFFVFFLFLLHHLLKKKRKKEYMRKRFLCLWWHGLQLSLDLFYKTIIII